MEYEKLLERAYSMLPDKSSSGARFEMPVIDSFTQGNKTIIKNFDEIAQQLRRESRELVKYFSRELAVPVTVESGRAVLQGRFNERFLNEKLQRYVKLSVFCKECGKADTKIIEVERGVKMIVCEACGARFPVRV
ncbi:MAG: translation initiation factor IF-2 subunit beta [Candidatus Micrarchaeia archaeon]